MSLWLTAEELFETTGFKTKRKWREALSQMGVRFLTRPADGFPLVERSQFEKGATVTPRRIAPRLEFLR